MIYQVLKSPKPSISKYQSQHTTPTNPNLFPFVGQSSTYKSPTLELDEWRIRQAEIERCFNSRNYDVGQVVRPIEDAKFVSEGLYKVMAICRNWAEYKGAEKDERKVPWPKEGKNPFIVHAQNMKNNRIYNCTINYFRPLTPEEITKLNGN